MAKNIDFNEVKLYLLSFSDSDYFGKYKSGSSHYFRLKRDKSGWNIIPYVTTEWDSLDQYAWNGKEIDATITSNDELPDWLPDIPTLEELQAVPSVNWRDMQKEADSFDANNYPYLKKYFIDNNLKVQQLYFALTEDVYESKYGDGTYRYLELASFGKQEIIDFVASCKGEEHYDYGDGRRGTNYSHIGFFKEHTIVFEEGKFYMPDFEPDTFEHYKFNELLKNIEEKLKVN